MDTRRIFRPTSEIRAPEKCTPALSVLLYTPVFDDKTLAYNPNFWQLPSTLYPTGLEMLFAKVYAHLKVMQKVGAARVKKKRGEAPPNLDPEISAGQGHQKEDIEEKHPRS